jgi:hypothetical protein
LLNKTPGGRAFKQFKFPHPQYINTGIRYDSNVHSAEKQDFGKLKWDVSEKHKKPEERRKRGNTKHYSVDVNLQLLLNFILFLFCSTIFPVLTYDDLSSH